MVMNKDYQISTRVLTQVTDVPSVNSLVVVTNKRMIVTRPTGLVLDEKPEKFNEPTSIGSRIP